jgi:signal transduction histidine kinase/CheY-like chemotaxis protein
MTDTSSQMHSRASQADGSTDPAAQAFVASNGNLLTRLILPALVVAAGLTVFPWSTAACWAAMIVPATLAEQKLLRSTRLGPIGWRGVQAARFAAVLITSLLYALAEWALIQRGDVSIRVFALALLSVSLVFALLDNYRAPKTFIVGCLPHMGILLLIGIANMQASAGHAAPLLKPVGTIGLFVFLLWFARAQLAGSWLALVSAKATAQARERAAQAANQAKSDFLATMSHEIRTPLNGVLGMAQAMTADELSDAQRGRLRVIQRSGETLLAILNDILDLAKIEAGALELEEVEFDMEHLVRGAVAAFRPAAEKKGLSFDFLVEEAARGHFRGDSIRLRQLLYNLISNAVKFTDAGQINVRVAHGQDTLTLSVVDTGVGIAPDKLSTVFETFVQADASSTRRVGGAGLGLSICSELVRLMNGALKATSSLGEGSTFTIILPLQRVSAAAAPPTAQSKPSAAHAAEEEQQDLRVLVAEDNSVNQLVLEALLNQIGIEPVMVDNGAKAVEAWEGQDWDIILMDIQMPEMDGADATRAIRAVEAQTGRRRTPILAVTANAMTHQVAAYAAAGMDAVVPKPIEAGRLYKALENALNGVAACQGAAA